MVYNTTDNRSSLSITDLTLDGEYSVTVAGRDGAGQLGQESEEINCKYTVMLCIYIFIMHSFHQEFIKYGINMFNFIFLKFFYH